MAATSAFGQGGIVIGNYAAPFNPVVWDAANGGGHVHSTDGVQLTLFFGQGAGLSDSQLNFSMPLSWNTQAEGGGYFGYYNSVVASLPGWANGQTWTFQVRASGNSTHGAVDTQASRSALWAESSNIKDIGGTPPGVPGTSANSIGLTVSVPEPTTFALAGLGGAALMIFRRRRS
jgi:hypothetical protein